MKMKKYLAVFFLLLFASFSVAEEKNEPAWVVTASKFTLKDVPELYRFYETAVPAMFNVFCHNPFARHVVGIDEKKAKTLADFGRKKLALIKERAKLIKERDSFYLQVMNASKKAKKTAALNKKIKAKEKKIEKMQADTDAFLAQENFEVENLPVTFWKDGKTVFEQPEHTNTAPALNAEKIDAVITGTIEDIEGYMYISATLTTGLPGMPEYTFSEAGTYESVETIVRSLSVQISAAIFNVEPVKVLLTVVPENAEVYLDDTLLKKNGKPFLLCQGGHHIEARASGYETAYKEINVDQKKNYNLKVKLRKEKTISVAFPFDKPSSDVFVHGQYFGESPVSMELPAKKSTIVTFSYSDVKTYVLVRPSKILREDQTSYELRASLNKVRTKTKIEKKRRILYWSLGALYVSLPIYMILQGMTADMASALKSSPLQSDSTAQKRYKNLHIATSVMQGMTIALGINYIVQLGLYLHATDQSIPKEAVRVR